MYNEDYVLVGASPGVSAFGASYEIGRRLICRPCLNRPPVSLGSAAFVAGYPCCRQGHTVSISNNDFHFRIFFAFHSILVFNIFLFKRFFIAASTFNLAFFRHKHLTAIRTEFHIIKHPLYFVAVNLVKRTCQIFKSGECIAENTNSISFVKTGI